MSDSCIVIGLRAKATHVAVDDFESLDEEGLSFKIGDLLVVSLRSFHDFPKKTLVFAGGRQEW